MPIQSCRSRAYGDVEPHLFASIIQGDERVRKAILAFARRNGFSVAISAHEVSPALLDTLDAAAEAGVEVLLNTGRLDMYPDYELVGDRAKMDEMLTATCKTIDAYEERFPEGRVFVWHEEPLFGNWSGETRHEMVDSVLEHGPEIFQAQQDAIRETAPGVDVGIFVHHPFLPDDEHTATPAFTTLMDRLHDRDSLPDFTYCDFYRGYAEWEAGYEGTNQYLASVMSNAKAATRGRPVYYLGQAHSINNTYTPSKQAIVGNLDTALAAGADSYGWYLRTTFRRTHDRNYNPFLPNTGTVASDQPDNSFTVSRDRLVWASLLLRERVDPVGEAVDLWVTANDAGFHENHVEVLTADDEWTYVGEFAGYLDGDNPYACDGRRATTVFHALDPDCIAPEDTLTLRLTGNDGSTGCTVTDLHVLPHAGPLHYRTEQEALALVEAGTATDACLGERIPALDIEAGDRTTLTLDLMRSGQSASAMSPPERTDGGEALRNADGTRHDRFDLWVLGDGLDPHAVSFGESRRSAATECEHYDTTDGMMIFRGLERDRCFEWSNVGSFVELWIDADPDSRVRSIHAMPAHGVANFTTAAEARDVLEAEYGDGHRQVDTFALGCATWPTGRTGSIETWLHVVDRGVREADPYIDHHPRMASTQW